MATQLVRDDLVEALPESGGDGEFEALIHRELELLGEDPERDGLLRTPARVASARKWMTRG